MEGGVVYGAALAICPLACTGIQDMPSGQAIETETLLTDEVESSVNGPCLEPTPVIYEVISITSGAVLCAGFLHMKDLRLGIAILGMAVMTLDSLLVLDRVCVAIIFRSKNLRKVEMGGGELCSAE